MSNGAEVKKNGNGLNGRNGKNLRLTVGTIVGIFSAGMIFFLVPHYNLSGDVRANTERINAQGVLMERVEAKVEKVDGKVEKSDEKLTGRINRVETKLDGVEGKIDKLDDKMDRLLLRGGK